MAMTGGKQKRRLIEFSDPGKILDLIMNLTDDTCSAIQMRINTYLREECDADFVFQVIVNCDRKEAFMEVVGTIPLPRKMKINLSPQLNQTIKSRIDRTMLLTAIDKDILALIEPYVPKDKTKKRLLMMPIDGKPYTVIVCVVAPKLLRDKIPVAIQECAIFVWPTLKKAIQLEFECTLKLKCQQLLRIAKRLFSQVASLETLLHLAMHQAKNLLKAEHCVIMLIDVDKMELYQPFSPLKDLTGGDGAERRFPLNMGISGEVIKTGALINTRNAKKHPLYKPSIDCLPDIDCKHLLCFPIREQTGIIGVCQLINKVEEPYFDGLDEEMALAFSIYCGVCTIHSVTYQKIQEAHVRKALSTELVMYHMKIGDDEVARLMTCSTFHHHPHLTSLHFNTRALPLRELPCYVIKMFSDLGFDKKFDIKTDKLARFILYVKKGYRDVPYHNWIHAFNVTQWAYAAMVNFKLIGLGYFNDLQGFMFLVAALLHDIDHRGTTSSFQVLGHTNLAALYSSEGSVMERHHLAQAMCILNTENCDILESLERTEFNRAIMLLRDNILATDLASYFKNLDANRIIAMDFQIGNQLHFNALQSLLMNAADLSDQIKEWELVKKTASAVLTEFFKQGELEKMRGDMPAPTKERDKCFIPDLEIEFLESTVIPLFDLLGEIIPKVASYSIILEAHIDKWEFSKPVFAGVPFTSGLAVLLSPELDNLIELNKIEAARLEQERLEAELLAIQKAKEAAEEESD